MVLRVIDLPSMAPHESLEMVRRSLPTGRVSDRSLDALLPSRWQAMSFSHWTPIAVARRLALELDAHGARRVLDIGSGAGKFCVVAAATCPELQLLGIERNVELVATARALAHALCLPNARFVLGDVLRVGWSSFDALYSFNPFVDEWTEVGQPALQLTSRLAQSRPGTVLATYFCCGAPIPATFELIGDDMIEGARLRVWVKSRSPSVERFHVESSERVETLTREQVMAALRRDLRRFA